MGMLTAKYVFGAKKLNDKIPDCLNPTTISKGWIAQPQIFSVDKTIKTVCGIWLDPLAINSKGLP
jgi:hypothetical protein